jgi:hypothetical protein
MNEILLTVVVRTEIEPAIGRVDVRIGAGCGKHILVTEVIEVARIIGPIDDFNCGVIHEKCVGLPPTGHRAFGRAESHGDHGCLVPRTILDGFEESAGPLRRMSRHEGAGTIRVEIECIPKFDHLEIRTGEGSDGRDTPMLAALEGQEDIFVGIRDLFGVVPLTDRGDVVDLVFGRQDGSMEGCLQDEFAGSGFDVLDRALGAGRQGLEPVRVVLHVSIYGCGV